LYYQCEQHGDAAHKHAVTAAFGNTYGYDGNGNQTSRTVAGVVYTLTYDYENRLTAVSGGSISASFVYDADGNRVKGTINSVTTVYVAGVYEYQNGATTLYYEGSAMRRSGYASDNGVFYNLQDHLKSTSSVVNQNGTLNGTPNYFFPYGGKRSAMFSALTTKRFTGQYHEAGLPGGEGLSYYNARWYDAQLGRFTSADTIVPGPSNPQALNRFSYVRNNPFRYVDPSGHAPIGVVPLIDPGPGGGGRKTNNVYLPIISHQSTPTLSRYPSAAFPRKPVPVATQPMSWTDTARRVTPVAKAATKDLWGCLFGSCALSIADWTGSVDLGGFWAPVGVVARGTISVAVDHEGGIALVNTLGTGGSTPTVSGGPGATFTNAPDVNKLAGDSIQIGGSVTAGVGVFEEGVFFKDSAILWALSKWGRSVSQPDSWFNSCNS